MENAVQEMNVLCEIFLRNAFEIIRQVKLLIERLKSTRVKCVEQMA
jgi:hypothetical protein